jgi:glyoxylase-like metal-dependent hydrolase (beta-lactamase superfamily II)
LYGHILPIDSQRVIVAADNQRFDLNGRELHCFYTEGHARHHYCLHDPVASAVFTGDSFGVSYRELDTRNGEFIFPTTTPVHFDPREAHRTVDRIVGLAPTQCLLTHYSRVTDIERLADDLHRCLADFVSMSESSRDSVERTLELEAAMFDYLYERAVKHGYPADEERLRAVIGMDVKLNTQGLQHWLDHGAPSDR